MYKTYTTSIFHDSVWMCAWFHHQDFVGLVTQSPLHLQNQIVWPFTFRKS